MFHGGFFAEMLFGWLESGTNAFNISWDKLRALAVPVASGPSPQLAEGWYARNKFLIPGELLDIHG